MVYISAWLASCICGLEVIFVNRGVDVTLIGEKVHSTPADKDSIDNVTLYYSRNYCPDS